MGLEISQIEIFCSHRFLRFTLMFVPADILSPTDHPDLH